MKWIEWIKLQSADLTDTTVQHITGISQEILSEPGLTALELYTHAVFHNEIALLLFWDIDLPPSKESQVGLQLAKELKTFGLVAHAVWVGV